MTEKSTLTAAKQSLGSILGECELYPDTILEACKRLNMPFKLVNIPKWSEHDAGANIYSERELFDLMFASCVIPAGNVFVVTDDSFISNNVWNVSGEKLGSLFNPHCPLAFDSDMIFIWPDSACLSVFHHEGAYTHIGWKM